MEDQNYNIQPKAVPKKKSFFSKFPWAIRSIDVYGKEVKFTVKGEENYRTFIGGIWTIMLFLGIFIYGAFQTEMMFARGDTNISIKTFRKDRTNDREVYTPFEKGFQYSFIVEKDGVDLMEEGGYVEVIVNQVKQTYGVNPATGVKERERTKESLDYEKCGDKFYSDDKATMENLNIANYYCFKNNYFTVAGSYFSPIFHYIEIRMAECMNTTENGNSCRTPEEIYDALNQADVKLGIINTYVALDDYEEPVKFFIDDSFYWETVPEYRKKIDTEIQKNIGEFQDSLLQLTPGDEIEFFQISKGMESYVMGGDDNEFLTIYLRTDDSYQLYDRKVYSIGDLLGQIGGFFEVLYAAGGFLTLLFVERMITGSIVSKIYQVESPKSDDDDSPRPSKSESSRIHKRKTAISSMSNIKQHESAIGMKDDSDRSKSSETDDHNEAKSEIQHRYKFKYNWKDISHYILCCGYLQKKCRSKTSKNKMLKQHTLFEVAEKQLKTELDVTEILLLLRKLRTIIHLLFNNDQTVLLEYQKLNVINPKSDKKPDDKNGDPEFNESIHFDNTELIDKLMSENMNERKVAGQQVENALKNIMCSLDSPFNKKLYQGLFETDLKNNGSSMYNLFKPSHENGKQTDDIVSSSDQISHRVHNKRQNDINDSHDFETPIEPESVRNNTDARPATSEHFNTNEDEEEEEENKHALPSIMEMRMNETYPDQQFVNDNDVTAIELKGCNYDKDKLSIVQKDPNPQKDLQIEKLDENKMKKHLFDSNLTPVHFKNSKKSVKVPKKIDLSSYRASVPNDKLGEEKKTKTNLFVKRKIFVSKDSQSMNPQTLNKITSSRSGSLLAAYEDKVTARLSKGNYEDIGIENTGIGIKPPPSPKKEGFTGMIKIDDLGSQGQSYEQTDSREI